MRRRSSARRTPSAEAPPLALRAGVATLAEVDGAARDRLTAPVAVGGEGIARRYFHVGVRTWTLEVARTVGCDDHLTAAADIPDLCTAGQRQAARRANPGYGVRGSAGLDVRLDNGLHPGCGCRLRHLVLLVAAGGGAPFRPLPGLPENGV